MSEIEYGKFCSVEDVIENRPGKQKYARLDGWVYRLLPCDDWMHEYYAHTPPSWRQPLQRLKYMNRVRKYVYMGYARCKGFKCPLCEEAVPQVARERIAEGIRLTGRSV